MKKIISLLLVLLLVVSFSTVAFAEGEKSTTPTTGTITIQGASAENHYAVYKMLDLSLNEGNGAFTYTVNSEWVDFFETYVGADGDKATNYITFNAADAAVWVGTETAARKEAFAKLAMTYVEAKNIQPVQDNDDFKIENGDGKFTNLPLGYYLVDSTMGALCGLTTTAPHASIQAKNAAPTLVKKVYDDDTAQWTDESTEGIGEIFEYRLTITVQAGAQNYVVHDKMEDGVSLVAGSFSLQHIKGTDTHVVPATYYTIKTTDLKHSDCDFEIVFTKEFCDMLETNNSVIITYKAKLNNNAEIFGTTDSNKDGHNDNTAWMTFGDEDENHSTAPQTVKTYTYFAEILKTDPADKMLKGAEFKIYNTADMGTGNEIAFVWDAAKKVYVRAGEQQTGDKLVVSDETVDTKGKIKIEGLDKGTYYLEEIKAPEGYNKLTSRWAFTISNTNLQATYDSTGVYTTGSGVQVINSTGTRLPETGGLGTLLFTILGGSTALGTGVVLVTKKRMSKIEDED